MSRKTPWMLAVGALVLTVIPAVGATPRATAELYGLVTDAVTGKPFDLSGGDVYIVDAFEVTTGERERVFASNPRGVYKLTDLDGGTYKVRVRLVDSTGLTRYWWDGGTQSYDTAATIAVAAGASVRKDFAVPVMAGTTLSGTLRDANTGTPIGRHDGTPDDNSCYSVMVFEASGIGLGVLYQDIPEPPDPDTGEWYSAGMVPAGDLTALAVFSTHACGTPPPYLDNWLGGDSGAELFPTDLIGEPRFMATAQLFTAVAGVPINGLDFEMIPTPDCDGLAPTIIGTTLADVIDGTAGTDVIVSLAGDDVVRGLTGHDRICTGSGNDRVAAGNGNDRVYTGQGIDVFRGGRGDDIAHLGSNRDRAWGGPGADILFGNSSDDRLNGGAGTPDIANGGGGTDVCVAEVVVACP